MTPLEETTNNQRKAADPKNSVFVMANAGSGKTRVLTDRVARLLLDGVLPQQILCITYTKAAASEMQDRLFSLLGSWALLDDELLRNELSKLEGENSPLRQTAELNGVRRLFARALETPGGLKIQTIHSFCESVLRRFPIEAGTPPGFTVIEEREAAALTEKAIDDLAIMALSDEALARDFSRLAAIYNEDRLREIFGKETRAGLAYAAITTRHGDAEGALSALAKSLGVEPSATTEGLQEHFISSFDVGELRHAKAILETGSKTQIDRAADIEEFERADSIAGKWQSLCALVLTTGGEPRKTLTTKPLQKSNPEVEVYLRNIQEEVVSIAERIKALDIFHNAAAQFRIVTRLRTLFEKAKAARAALDFDDLILVTRRLLENQSADWVRYKLDYGVDHILVDETQDTSPDQWSVIEALIDDYLSGSSAREDNRTFFAVGDIKQSIYSFQGADAELFETKEAVLGKRLAEYHQQDKPGNYRSLDLSMSFRTTQPVLSFVDAAFANEEVSQGLGKAGVPAHIAHRAGAAGSVEVWPLTPRSKQEPGNAWDMPIDAPEPSDPVRVLTDRIATTIKGWLDQKEHLESADRPIVPDDILILVQTRGRLFDAVLSALARSGVPVAGADRLKLLEDVAVEDLLSYAKFCVLSSDDLSLAEILKSPLFNFTDDDDLFPLAYERGQYQTLWGALRERADEKNHWQRAVDQIELARQVALREGPYAFLSHVLETGNGRRKFYRRLSDASRDAIDEMLRQALDFEQGEPRSLRSFISWFEENAAVIKREMERGDNAVRVMTVHGAKGLEANIVFLLDAHKLANTRKLGMPLELVETGDHPARTGHFRLLVGAQKEDTTVTSHARLKAKEKLYEEYRRLFYVAATRARDRLYVTGIESGNQKNPRDRMPTERSWHSLAHDALDRLSDTVVEHDAPLWADSDERVRSLSSPQVLDIVHEAKAKAADVLEIPAWLKQPAPVEHAPLQLSPSRLADEEEASAGVLPEAAPAYTPTGADRYFRGRVLHRLLELLPSVEEAARSATADRLLARLASSVPESERTKWRDEVLTVLHHPEFTAVFGAQGRAEVSIAGDINGHRINGQIDRLLIAADKVLVVDYKTNRPPPSHIKDIAPAYLAQMAAYRALLQEIYPAHQVECALLWTFEARISVLPESLLDHAFARWLRAG